MKKIIVMGIIAAMFFACNSTGEKTTTPETKQSVAMTNPDYDAGLELVAKSD